MDGQLPSNWAPGGKTLRVQLDPLQEECHEVAAYFKGSLRPAPSAAILRVERAQNPALYQGKKRDMEARRGGPGAPVRAGARGEAAVPQDGRGDGAGILPENA